MCVDPTGICSVLETHWVCVNHRHALNGFSCDDYVECLN